MLLGSSCSSLTSGKGEDAQQDGPAETAGREQQLGEGETRAPSWLFYPCQEGSTLTKDEIGCPGEQLRPDAVAAELGTR